MGELVDRAVATALEYLRLGNEATATRLATLVRNPSVPDIGDANHAQDIRLGESDDVDAFLAATDVFCFKVDPHTPPHFHARLMLEGYRASVDLEMVLTGDLVVTPPPVEIRVVVSDDDWESLRRLKRVNDEDDAKRGNHAVRAVHVSEQMWRSKRAKWPAVQYFLAHVNEEDCAYFSAWPGDNGVGIVEDLFTARQFRGRGIATALIAHAVADARLRGAGPVIIDADPDDTPKHLYARLGFQPAFALHSCWRPEG